MLVEQHQHKGNCVEHNIKTAGRWTDRERHAVRHTDR